MSTEYEVTWAGGVHEQVTLHFCLRTETVSRRLRNQTGPLFQNYKTIPNSLHDLGTKSTACLRNFTKRRSRTAGHYAGHADRLNYTQSDLFY